MGLLDGLENFGLGSLVNVNLFEKEKPKPVAVAAKQKAAPVIIPEEDYLYDKTYTCPVCDKSFRSKTCKIGKARLLSSDMDLRPKYEGLDLLKYDVVMCYHCGFAVLTRYVQQITGIQAKLVKANIADAFRPQDEVMGTYSYEYALERYKLALANAVVRQAKASEKAYICLKTAWLLRGNAENMDKETEDYETKQKELKEAEEVYLKNTLEGFTAARQSEGFPMCGMDEPTVDFLLAVLATQFNQLDLASRLVSSLIASNSANNRTKDRARDLKEIIMKKVKESKQSS